MKESESKMEENKTVQGAEVKPSQLHYDAFISYRHTELDKFVAENLHKKLEAYRMPADVAKKRQGMKNKIERVFRDQEELPLTSDLNDPIMAALHNSDWLIVICSPRLRESVWCKKEIETFVKLRGRQRVLAVLVEGEPSESFPDELLFEVKTVTKADGSVEEVKVPVEPLAADVRGKNKKDILKNMDIELLRILAAMFHLNFDDLRQRHKEQRMKRAMFISVTGGAVCLVFAIFCACIAIAIHKQNITIRELSDVNFQQSEELKYEQALSLAEQARELMEDDERENAIQTAVTAITDYEIFHMPYTPQAHGALIESLRCYDTGSLYKAQYEMETVGLVNGMRTSPEGTKVAVLDEVDRLYVWDIESNEVLAILQMAEFSTSDSEFAFIDEDRIVYRSGDDVVSVYDLNKQEIIKDIEVKYLSNVYVDAESEHLVMNCASTYQVYDADSYERLGEIKKLGELSGYQEFFALNDTVMAFTRIIDTTEGQKDCIFFVDYISNETLSVMEISNYTTFDIKMREGVAYIAYDQYDEQSEMTTYLQAYDISSGVVKWNLEIEKSDLKLMEISRTKWINNLMIATGNEIILVNVENGNIVKEESVSGIPVGSYAYKEQNVYTVLTESGSFYMVDEIARKVQDCSELFVINPKKIEFFGHTLYGEIIIPYNTNRVINYNTQTGPSMENTEWSGRETPGNFIMWYDAEEILAEYGVTDSDLVYGVYYDPEQSNLFVCYKDRRVSVYATNGQILLSTFDVEEIPDSYLGKDSFGNTYLGSAHGGYMLGENMELCTYIRGLKDVDKEKDILYIVDEWGQPYQTPIYSLQELIQLAGPYLELNESEIDDESGYFEG
ncbi:MAG: toll/interleukin-1 receptor domain-containing protein [Lachnospiraceae bacterium]|nr:toll/interleukin-1 receptor domain-containing protein [Lachnospiraceae bacterium]